MCVRQLYIKYTDKLTGSPAVIKVRGSFCAALYKRRTYPVGLIPISLKS